MNQPAIVHGETQLERSEPEASAMAEPGALDDSARPEAPCRPDRRTRTERRAHPRFQFTTSAEILDLNSGAQCSARTSDISLGGCFIDTTSPFAVGTSVKLRLTQEKKVFVAEAVITSTMAGMGMGVQFKDVAPPQMEILKRWIAQLSGDLTPTFAGFEEEGEDASCPPLQGELSYTLNELILALMRKGILSEGQGREMLRRLHG